MFDGWWKAGLGVGENCLFVKEASSRAIKSPIKVTPRAANLRRRGMLIIGVFIGSIDWVIIKPAKMLPRARRLMGLITAELFSLMGDREANRGCPIATKKITRRL